MARWHKKGIPLQPADKTAEYAGFQYTIQEREPEHSKHYKYFRESLMRLVYSNFKWYGMNEHESEMIEYLLINEGRCCAVKSEFSLEEQSPDGVFFGRPGTDVPNLRYDFYGRQTQCSCTGFSDAIYRALDPEHFVIGFDTSATIKNQTMIAPISTYIDELAADLDNAYSMWRVAAETRKAGMVFNVPDEKSRNLLQRVLYKRSANNPWIVITGNGNAFEEMTQPQFAPNNTDALADYHDNFLNIWSSVLDLLGLENSPNSKQERLVVAEALSNKNTSRYLAADRLKARKRFCDEMNEKFGTNYDVENYMASIAMETMNQANMRGDSVSIGGNENEESDSRI